MICLKKILSLFILFALAFPIYAQNGFKVIKKAEQKYKKGQSNKALKLLSKAEKMDYGFCGNAWMEAERSINLLKAEIYINKGEYQLARNSLDSIRWEYSVDNLDSIRIRTYQMQYGKDSLSNMIDTSFSNAKIICDILNCNIIIPLSNNEFIKLYINRQSNKELYFIMLGGKIEDKKWIKYFKNTENYKLLIEKE